MVKGRTFSEEKCGDNPMCEQKMREGFATTVTTVLASAQQYEKPAGTMIAGLEIELPLVTPTFDLAPQRKRDALLEKFVGHTSLELAAHQLEIISEPPVDLIQHGLGALGEQISSTMTTILREVSAESLQAVRIGCYPLAEIDDVDYTRGDPRYHKYERCPQWHMARRRQDIPANLGHKEVVCVENAYVVGLLNSVQINIDAQNFRDAIEKLNRSLMISPYAIAISANARYLDCQDTGMCDLRFSAWETSHDVRSPKEIVAGLPTRIGLPQRYYYDLEDYFEQIQSYPFIMDDPFSLAKPFEVGLGLCWRDARLKFFREKHTVAVEFRPVSLQPSLREDIAMMLFYLGRLVWSQNTNESLQPMDIVRKNKQQAELYGLRGMLWSRRGGTVEQVSARLALEEELHRAIDGLKHLGASTDILDNLSHVFEQRLQHGSPAEQFATVVEDIERNLPETRRDRRRRALIGAIQELGLVVP